MWTDCDAALWKRIPATRPWISAFWLRFTFVLIGYSLFPTAFWIIEASAITFYSIEAHWEATKPAVINRILNNFNYNRIISIFLCMWLAAYWIRMSLWINKCNLPPATCHLPLATYCSSFIGHTAHISESGLRYGSGGNCLPARHQHFNWICPVQQVRGKR